MFQRTHHFQIRLFESLPWIASQQNARDPGKYLFTPIPRPTYTLPSSLEQYLKVENMSAHLSLHPGTFEIIPAPTCLRFRDDFWVKQSEPPYEAMCMFLERSFSRAELLCECCEQEQPQRCPWCLHAVGWHRCERRMRTRALAYADMNAYVWKRNTLYHEQHDTEVTVLSMLRQGLARPKIHKILGDLREDEALTEQKHKELLHLVQSLTGGLIDTSPTAFSANSEFIASTSHKAIGKLSLDDARDALRGYEEQFQQLWDPSTNSYRHYSQHSEKRRCPTQYIALEQLRARMENHVPLLVGVAAPAGYGKSQLIQAWLAYLQTRPVSPIWSVLAMTGVAASNAGGTTLHAFFQLRKETGSGLYSDNEAAFRFQEVAGLIIDEAYMADQETFFTVIQICAQLPLHERLRRPNAIPLFGYRDVFLLGDLRQLPPASGNQPFWATDTFQNFFEIMVLREDRRHEKDAEMRALKELLAWGGCEHARPLSNDEGWEQPWPIDDRVQSAILDMTLQGIGLSGHTVDPDVGTAIFARHVEKDMWNDAYVHHVERLYWDQGLEAVDVVGFNPVLKEAKKEADTRRSTGLQAPRILKLRTCPQHRLRTVIG